MSTWPEIPYARWAATGASLHMWSQIVGKFRLAREPWRNHSWHATFYIDPRGLTTSLVPGDRRSFEIKFDFVDHQLIGLCTDGSTARFALEPMSVAQFHARFLNMLAELGAETKMHGAPNEVPNPVAFKDQTTPGAYDPAAATDFWQALVSIGPVFEHFRTGFLGKTSPVHLFWGSFDLAVTRFSGRKAPTHPGGFPALPDSVTRDAYSHEVCSAGFWPGGGGAEEAMFYSYAYPQPDGFRAAAVAPEEAYFDEALGEFLLSYEAVRRSAAPAKTLMAFLNSTYEAAASLGKWDRSRLERRLGLLGAPHSE